jgi:hemerythrin-like domain-containing protein
MHGAEPLTGAIDAGQQLLRQDLEKLQSIYTEHIKLEDTVIFPLASRHLSQDAIQAIGKEFQQRRKQSA